jgi:protein gp37
MRINNGAVSDQYGMTDDDGCWTGRAEPLYQNIETPLHVRKPQAWALWNDLFHDDIPVDFIHRVWTMMALCPQHFFFVLTKRADRMAHVLASFDDREVWNVSSPWVLDAGIVANGQKPYPCVGVTHYVDRSTFHWPLLNVALGVTVESPEHVTRAHTLCHIRAAMRFLSIEPLLGPVHLADCVRAPVLCYESDPPITYWPRPMPIHLVIAGCESGSGRRPSDTDWFRGLRDECIASGTSYFLKQMDVGGRVVKVPELDGQRWNQLPERKADHV